jgi:signal transduction histidine kinase
VAVPADALVALADHLRDRRAALMQAWREAVRTDPALTTNSALPRRDLNDDIPRLLSAFEREIRRLGSNPDANGGVSGDVASAHGLHRWQQGYDLREVTRELGRLNECVVAELEAYAASNPDVAAEVMATTRQLWARTCTEGIAASATQYFRLQQVEAAGHVGKLERALQDIRELERSRAELWQEAAHDLRGGLGVVANASFGLSAGVSSVARDNLLRLLQRNVASLHALLNDVTDLARLQAGQDRRQLAQVDVAALLCALCEDLAPLAEQRGLYLHRPGPAPFVVEGDAVKIRRLAQNLVLNAIKYTRQGGVDVSWGESEDGDGKRWALSVTDTGPGFQVGPAAIMADALEAASTGASPPDAAPMPPEGSQHRRSAAEGVVPSTAGEGIGLSIVKRLCELLDATFELESGTGTGTAIRILLPRHYETDPQAAPAR